MYLLIVCLYSMSVCLSTSSIHSRSHSAFQPNYKTFSSNYLINFNHHNVCLKNNKTWYELQPIQLNNKRTPPPRKTCRLQYILKNWHYQLAPVDLSVMYFQHLVWNDIRNWSKRNKFQVKYRCFMDYACAVQIRIFIKSHSLGLHCNFLMSLIRLGEKKWSVILKHLKTPVQGVLYQ